MPLFLAAPGSLLGAATLGVTMNVIAFHGKPGRAYILKRDMDNPPWVSTYFAGHNVEAAEELVHSTESPVLVGYSYGGQVIADLSNKCKNIIGVVLYEAPLYGPCNPYMPVMQIWNNKGRRHWPAARRSRNLWSCAETYMEFVVPGKHIRFTSSWPFLGHDWNTDVNDLISVFLEHCKLKAN